MRDFKEYTIWNNVTPKAITSSTNASPTVLTVASHGFSTGDQVMVYGHTTNTAANGLYEAVVLSASTLSLKNVDTKVAIAGNGVGGATGVIMAAPKIALANDFTNATLQVSTSGTATTTIGVAGSQGNPTVTIHGDTPIFGATISPSNPYSFINIIDLNDGSSISGATGVVVAGTDITKNYELNINELKYTTLIPVSWTAGAITAKIILTNNQ